MILLECPETGERCLVESAEGYDGWRVLADSAPLPIDEHYDWNERDGRWRADPERRLRFENLAAMRDPEALLAIIEDLYAEIAALKAKEN